ncbi:MAG: hypothetical protein MR292_09590 [Alistipes sp.]|nr:hypothetical protein [Alistipes sp.]
MSFFSPYKRHANKFNYKPRYYDPDREERERRRAELRGERLDDTEEYTPGKYIRTRQAAREARRAESGEGTSRMRMWVLGMGVMLLALFIYLILPRLMAVFEMAQEPASGPRQESVEEFNPYAPIVVVPNDYEEGDQIEIVEE